jgi:hypothetical protein
MIIIETGDGLADANSYAAVTTAENFAATMGYSAWADASTNEKEIALVRATSAIDTTYRASIGDKRLAAQSLQWPRTVVGLPLAVVRATMFLAMEALEGPIAQPIDRAIVSEENTLAGVGTFKATYEPTGPVDRYPHISAILEGIASPRSAGFSVVRLTR